MRDGLENYLPLNLEHLHFRGPPSMVTNFPNWSRCALDKDWLLRLTISFVVDAADGMTKLLLGTPSLGRPLQFLDFCLLADHMFKLNLSNYNVYPNSFKYTSRLDGVRGSFLGRKNDVVMIAVVPASNNIAFSSLGHN